MRCAFKYRLYPNTNQMRELGIMLESHRRLYNACLAQRRDAWESEQRSVKYFQQSAWFKAQRLTNAYFARLNFSSAQATMRRLDKAFDNFFRRVKAKTEKPGYPRFKPKDRFDSVEFPAYGDGIRLNERLLRVQHVGLIKTKVHRPIEGQIKTATLKFEGDKWYVVLSCDLGEVQIAPSTQPAVGIDLGLESFLTTSNGEQEPNPRYLRVELPALRRASRAVSRKRKGSHNRRKAAKQLRVLHARVANLRREHHHQASLKLVRNYGLIAVEHLDVKGMLQMERRLKRIHTSNHKRTGNQNRQKQNHRKPVAVADLQPLKKLKLVPCQSSIAVECHNSKLWSRRMNRAISDAGWSAFVNTLKHKAERAGVEIVKVDPKGTSQQCSGCGAVVRKELSIRTHRCSQCGLILHRDENAARNILARGLRARTEPVRPNAALCVAV